jgi:hypothetical protein
MGYGFYEIDGRKRGYGVRCKCHKRGCAARIDRGLFYLCYACTWYFCADHLTVAGDQDYLTAECFAGEGRQVCERCARQLERAAKGGKVMGGTNQAQHEHTWEAIGDPALSDSEQMWRCSVCGRENNT